MTASSTPAPSPGGLLARVFGALCLLIAVALGAGVVVRPEIAPGPARTWAWGLVAVLVAAGAVTSAGARRRERPGRFLSVAVAAIAGLLMTYVVVASPSAPPASAAAQPAVPPLPKGADPIARADGVARRYTPYVGVSTPTLADYDAFVRTTGTRPEFFDVFEPWSDNRPLDLTVADAIAARGTELEITWQPWDPKLSDSPQPRYRLSTIVSGQHDGYIDLFAASVKAYGKPVEIRLMHEMNGNWYPWGRGVDGNRPQDFVAAWQHVVDRFRADGATNVRWMWAPNAVYTGSAPLAPLYPGDAYVDDVGLSNYNWGDQSHDGFTTTWATFGDLFDASIAQVRALTARPLWIAETGSTDEGGSKAGWITDMFTALAQRPDIAGLVWFDREDTNARADWRIENDPAAVAAWKAGMLGRATVPEDGGPGGRAD